MPTLPVASVETMSAWRDSRPDMALSFFKRGAWPMIMPTSGAKYARVEVIQLGPGRQSASVEKIISPRAFLMPCHRAFFFGAIAVLLCDGYATQVGQTARPFVDSSGGIIGGAVIHNDNFQMVIGIGLCGQCPQTRIDVGGFIASGNDNGNGWTPSIYSPRSLPVRRTQTGARKAEQENGDQRNVHSAKACGEIECEVGHAVNNQ